MEEMERKTFENTYSAKISQQHGILSKSNSSFSNNQNNQSILLDEKNSTHAIRSSHCRQGTWFASIEQLFFRRPMAV